MEEADSDPLDAGARSYWEEADVDGVFNRVCEYLEQLRCSLKSKTATYTDYVQGLRLVRLVEAGRIPGTPDSSSIHDVIIAGVLPTLVSSQEEVGEVEEAEEAAPSAPLSPLLLHSDVLVLPLAPPSAGQEEPEEVSANQEEISAGLKEREGLSANQEEEMEGLSANQEEEMEGLSANQEEEMEEVSGNQEEEMEEVSAIQEEEMEEQVSADQEEQVSTDQEEQVSADQEEQVSTDQEEQVSADQEEQVSADQEEVSADQEEVSADQEEEVSADQEEVSADQALYQPHQCTKACLPSLPRTSQPFWGQNPLKVPLLCGFKRLGEQEVTSEELPYITPCGLRLHSHEDVMRFLFSTESYDVLQVEFFTFNAAVRLNPPLAAGPRLPELDLSRGLEPTPVELCPGEAGTRPQDFRYRKDRWPHGCFLSASPALFHTCCDCLDGCLDALRCACRGRSSRGPHYTHHNLPRPLEAGLLECGPWCGCDRARCQNRLVQQGVRVRLQVFQNTTRGGWGVRCRDDLDQGTFICTYAGLVLRKGRDSEEAPPPNRLGAEPSSDDDVEVVTEWLVPPGTDGVPPTSALLHVPVIQRPSEPPHLSPPITPQQTQNQETQTQQTQTQETETQNQETKTQPNQTQETQETQETQNQEAETQNQKTKTQPNQNQQTQETQNQEAETQTQETKTQSNQNQQTQETQNQEPETQTQETKTQPNQTQETQLNQNQDSPARLEGHRTVGGCLATGDPSPDGGAGQSAVREEVVAAATVEQSHRVRAQPVRKRKREEDEDVYYLDATKEGNVARFLNQSCRPNLFTQSVFTDTQDPGFPIVAFFTSRVIKAGTELTWKCSPDTGSASPGQEVACQCGNEDCEGVTNCDQAMCEVCDVHENVHENVQKA